METSTANSSTSRTYRSEAAAEIDRPAMQAAAPFAARVAAVARGGSIAEQTAVYHGLSLYPDPRSLLAIASEAVRSARRPVFEAIAHDNPYPAAHFGDALWNEMVVRALRLGSRLAPIEGLDDRRNAELADTLIGYVRERRAAHRSVNPEVWRCIGPFAADAHFDELLGAFRSGGHGGGNRAFRMSDAGGTDRARKRADAVARDPVWAPVVRPPRRLSLA
jgi:hypothetical protein